MRNPISKRLASPFESSLLTFCTLVLALDYLRMRAVISTWNLNIFYASRFHKTTHGKGTKHRKLEGRTRNDRHLHLLLPAAISFFFNTIIITFLFYFALFFYWIKIQIKCDGCPFLVRCATIWMEPWPRKGSREDFVFYPMYLWISTEESAPCTFASPVGGAMRAPETENRNRSTTRTRTSTRTRGDHWNWSCWQPSPRPSAFHSWVECAAFGSAELFPHKSSTLHAPYATEAGQPVEYVLGGHQDAKWPASWPEFQRVGCCQARET